MSTLNFCNTPLSVGSNRSARVFSQPQNINPGLDDSSQPIVPQQPGQAAEEDKHEGSDAGEATKGLRACSDNPGHGDPTIPPTVPEPDQPTEGDKEDAESTTPEAESKKCRVLKTNAPIRIRGGVEY